MELETLVPYLKASVNPPGTDFFTASTKQWTDALAAAFWWGRIRGFFPGYRVNSDMDQIVPVEGAEEFGEVESQVVVAIAALNSLEAKIGSLPTGTRYKAGSVEAETTRSAQVLAELLKTKRRELEELKDELSTSASGMVGIIDAVLAREGSFMAGEAVFVR